VVQQGFRASGHNQTRGIELSCPPFIAHKDAILDISSSEARTGIFASTSMDKTAKIWVIRNKRRLFNREIKNESGQCFTKYTGHRGAVNSISIHSTKHLAITGSGNSFNLIMMVSLSDGGPLYIAPWPIRYSGQMTIGKMHFT